MRKWMDEFQRKSEGHGDKIARVNSIRITKSINLLKFCTELWSVVVEGDFPCTASPFIEKSMVYIMDLRALKCNLHESLFMYNESKSTCV